MWNLVCHCEKRMEIKTLQEQTTFQNEFMLLVLRVYPPLSTEHRFMLSVVKMICDEVQPISMTSAPPAKSIESLVT
jgi:hypothetical protein